MKYEFPGGKHQKIIFTKPEAWQKNNDLSRPLIFMKNSVKKKNLYVMFKYIYDWLYDIMVYFDFYYIY